MGQTWCYNRGMDKFMHRLTQFEQDGKLPAAIYASGYGLEGRQGVPGWRVQCSCGWLEKAESSGVARKRYDQHREKMGLR